MVLVVLLEVFVLVSSVASVNISLTSGELCEGAVATWTCVVDGSAIGWRNLGQTEFPASVSPNLVALGSPSPFSSRATCSFGGFIISIATANLTSAVDGSTLECSDGSFDLSGTTIASVDLSLKEQTNLSLVLPELISMNETKLEWVGAQCVLYYIVEVNDTIVNTTTETSYIYELDPNEMVYIFTIYGVGYTGNIFTSDSKRFLYTRPLYNASHILADDDLFIIIESKSIDQLNIISCCVTFNSGDCANCSETNRVFKYDVTPGESYNYSVEIVNDVGPSVYNDTVTVPMDPLPSVSPSTAEPQSELPDWALGVVIALVILLIVAAVLILVLLCIIWKLWSSQDKINKKVATANLRTHSPDGKESTTF